MELTAFRTPAHQRTGEAPVPNAGISFWDDLKAASAQYATVIAVSVVLGIIYMWVASSPLASAIAVHHSLGWIQVFTAVAAVTSTALSAYTFHAANKAKRELSAVRRARSSIEKVVVEIAISEGLTEAEVLNLFQESLILEKISHYGKIVPLRRRNARLTFEPKSAQDEARARDVDALPKHDSSNWSQQDEGAMNATFSSSLG